MTTLEPHDDRALWIAYATAASAEDRRALGSRIVEMHMGFLYQYVAQHAFPSWDQETRTEYLHELVAVMLRKVPDYDRHHQGHDGRVATFPTYVKPYLQDVRWMLRGKQESFQVGKEQMRMIVDLRMLQAAHESAGIDPPTLEELADHLSMRHGKRVTESRVARMLARPDLGTIDAPGVNGREARHTVADPAAGPHDAVPDMVAAAELSSEVAELTSRMKPVQRALVIQRLMAEEPVPLSELAPRLGMSVEALRRVERDLADFLRDRLADFR